MRSSPSSIWIMAAAILLPAIACADTPAGDNVRAIPRQLGASSLALSSDGRRLAYSVIDPQKHTQEIWIAHLRSGDSRRIDQWVDKESSATEVASRDNYIVPYPMWSPDGRRLAYFIEREDGVRLSVWDVAKGMEIYRSQHKRSEGGGVYCGLQWLNDHTVIFPASTSFTVKTARQEYDSNVVMAKSGAIEGDKPQPEATDPNIVIMKSAALKGEVHEGVMPIWTAPLPAHIVAADVQVGTERVVASGVDFSGFRLSADRKTVVAIVREEAFSNVGYHSSVYRVPLDLALGGRKAAPVKDPASAKITGAVDARGAPLELLVSRISESGMGRTVSLSPSGKFLAYTSSQHGEPGDVFVMDLKTRRTRNLTASVQLPASPLDRYGDGRRREDAPGKFGSMSLPPIWTADERAVLVPNAVTRAGWKAQFHQPVTVDLWQVPVNGGEPKRVPVPPQMSIAGVALCNDVAMPCVSPHRPELIVRLRVMQTKSPADDIGALVIINYQTGATRALRTIGPTGFGRAAWNAAEFDITEINAVVDTGYATAVVLEETQDRPPELWQLPLHSASDARSLKLINPEPVAPPDRYVRVTWSSRDQEEIGATLRIPQGLPAGKRPPVIAIVYDHYMSRLGTDKYDGGADTSQFLPLRKQLGFATLHVDTPVSYQRMGTHCTDSAANVQAAFGAAAATGLIDATRTGIIGLSYGGYMVNCMVTRMSFSAAVSISPIYNLTRIAASFPANSGFVEYMNLRDGPWKHPQAFVDETPVFHLDKVRTPVLLVGGTLDRDHYEHAQEMFNDLSALGKPVQFLGYRNTGHGGMLYYPDFWSRVGAWFNKWFDEA